MFDSPRGLEDEIESLAMRTAGVSMGTFVDVTSGIMELDNGESKGNYYSILGVYRNQMETTRVYWGLIGVMEKKMEATIVYL